MPLLNCLTVLHNGGLDGSPTDSYALGYTLYTYLKNIGEVTGIDDMGIINIMAAKERLK